MSTHAHNADGTEHRATVSTNRQVLDLNNDTYAVLRNTADKLREQCRITTRSATPDSNWYHYAAAVIVKMGWPTNWHGGDRRKQEAMDGLLKHFAGDAARKVVRSGRRDSRREEKEAVELMEVFSAVLGEDCMDAATTSVYIKVVKKLRPLLGSGAPLKALLEDVLELVKAVVEKKVQCSKELGIELTQEERAQVEKRCLADRDRCLVKMADEGKGER